MHQLDLGSHYKARHIKRVILEEGNGFSSSPATSAGVKQLEVGALILLILTVACLVIGLASLIIDVINLVRWSW